MALQAGLPKGNNAIIFAGVANTLSSKASWLVRSGDNVPYLFIKKTLNFNVLCYKQQFICNTRKSN